MRKDGNRQKRTSLVVAHSSAQKEKQKEAVRTVLVALESGLENPTSSCQVETKQQQLCPLKVLPNEFLIFKSAERPNPLHGPRGKLRLDTYQTNMLNFRSKLLPSQPLFRPQGAHPLTGQELPPLFNDDARMATGEDTASLCKNSNAPNFAFQVVNNNYNMQSPLPGALNIRVPTKNSKQSEEEKRQFLPKNKKKKRTETGENVVSKRHMQSTFFGSPSVSKPSYAISEILRATNCVKDILRMWVYPNFSIGLKKPLKDWTPSERNGRIKRSESKTVLNSKLYARRKVQAMAFFHFCSLHSVDEYLRVFTDLNQQKLIGVSYNLSVSYAKRNDFVKLFKLQEQWNRTTEIALSKQDVVDALKE